MRKIFVFALIVIPCTLFCQEKYFTTGTEWYYNLQESYEYRDYGYRKYKVLGDTLIEGDRCKVVSHIVHRHSGEIIVYDPLIFKVIGGKIDLWEKGQFLTVYNFDLGKGDTLFHSLYNYQSCDSLTPLIIDSVQTIMIDGIALKKQFASQTLFFKKEYKYIKEPVLYEFVERIGDLESFVFKPRCDAADDWGANWSLRCYNDGDLHFRNTWWKNYRCDAIVTKNETFKTSSGIKIFPVKVDDMLCLHSEQPAKYTMSIIGLTGNRVQSGSGILPEKITTSLLNPGFYLIRICANKEVNTFKFYKQ